MINKIKFALLSLLTFLCTNTALAYIPPYWMIMSRVADNHGKGIYIVEQDVVFGHGDGNLVVNERWIIQNENSMRLEVAGRRGLEGQLRLTYVYDDGRKYFIDEAGNKRSEAISDDFFEIYFHNRFSKNVKPLLIEQKIAPAVSLKSEPHRYSQKRPLPEPEPYVRLARSGGVVNYAIGTPSPAGSTAKNPGIWIEQDKFVVRKLRLASQVEISASNYRAFQNNLMLPQDRLLTWNQNSAKIFLKNASPVGATDKIKSALLHSNLKSKEETTPTRVLPTDEVVREFYLKMR